MVGGDGRLTEELARWVNMAENQDTDDSGDPAVLLILDLCHSGAVVTEHLRSLVRPERRRVWVTAACHSEQDAYDGRLSTAVDEVLRGFASGTLKLDTSVPYIPIARFCREVALHVESRSTALNPQSVEQPLAALGADLSHLRFRWVNLSDHGDIVAVPRPSSGASRRSISISRTASPPSTSTEWPPIYGLLL
jgi:hypothetical protein